MKSELGFGGLPCAIFNVFSLSIGSTNVSRTGDSHLSPANNYHINSINNLLLLLPNITGHTLRGPRLHSLIDLIFANVATLLLQSICFHLNRHHHIPLNLRRFTLVVSQQLRCPPQQGKDEESNCP